MNQKERLIERTDTFCKKELGANFNKDSLGKFADYILADGWFRPPCKVEDKVYKVRCTNYGHCCGISDFDCDNCPYENRQVVEGTVLAVKFIKGIRLKVRFDTFTDYFGEDELYYAREEAEQALKGAKQ